MQSPGPQFRAKDSGSTSMEGAQAAPVKIKKPQGIFALRLSGFKNLLL
jgi:hypothetical protein